jgi:hypothetical protein
MLSGASAFVLFSPGLYLRFVSFAAASCLFLVSLLSSLLRFHIPFRMAVQAGVFCLCMAFPPLFFSALTRVSGLDTTWLCFSAYSVLSPSSVFGA